MTVTASIDDEKSNVGKYEIGKYRTNFFCFDHKRTPFQWRGKGREDFRAEKWSNYKELFSLFRFCLTNPSVL